MAVVKDFSVRHSVTNFIELTSPKLDWSGTELRWNSPGGITWRIELSTNFSQWTDRHGVLGRHRWHFPARRRFAPAGVATGRLSLSVRAEEFQRPPFAVILVFP